MTSLRVPMYRVAIWLPIFCLAVACRPGSPWSPWSPTASLSVRVILSDSPRSFLPPIDMDPASIEVTCTGPAGQRLTAVAVDGTAAFDALEAGRWSVAALALNGAGTAIGEGSNEVEIESALESSVTVTVAPLSGAGIFELELLWPLALAAIPALQGALTPEEGLPVDLVFVLEGAAATAQAIELPAGYYTLVVQLFDDGTVVAGAAEAVRIVAGQTTQGRLDFSDLEGSPGSLTTDLVLELADPLSVGIAGAQETVGVDQSLLVTAWPPDLPVDAGSGWFLDGFLVGSGPTHTLESGLALGVHRVDLVARSAATASAGSASFLVEVVPSFPTGSLARSVAFVDGRDGVDGLNTCRSVAVTPDGRSVYVTGYDDSAIAHFERDEATGMLAYAGCVKEGVDGVSGIEGAGAIGVSPDGGLVIAGGATPGSIALFRRDPASGALAFERGLSSSDPGLEGLAGLRALALSPDGLNLYVAGANSLIVFGVDGASLTMVQQLTDELDGIVNLAGPSAIAFSPDGNQLLVTTYDDDSLLVFARSPADGSLALSQSFTDESDGCDGLNGANSVVAAPDGTAVYVAAYYDSAVTAFARSPADGSLTPVAEYRDGVDGVDGLYHAQAAALSADGASLYVAASGDDAVACFQCEAATALLGYLGRLTELPGARGLALSPDGMNCYLAAAEANTLAVLNRRR